MKRQAVAMRRGAFLLLMPLLGLAGGCSLFDTGYPLARELQKQGTPAQAEILSIANTGVAINDDPVIRLEVEVRPPNGPPYKATIPHLLISTLEIPQYQPGTIIGVRFDPNQPQRVSIDLGPPAAAKTGNPFHDNFTAAAGAGPNSGPAATVTLYRGTADPAADQRALFENSYDHLGSSQWSGDDAADPEGAVRQGTRLGAAVVVLYGNLRDTPGVAVAPFPFRPRPAGYSASGPPPVADTAGSRATIGLLPPRPAGEHSATYWIKTRQTILGILSRPLDGPEKARLMRNDGIFVELVMNDSPAATAHIQPGDIVLAIDGKPILDLTALPAFLASVAGHTVRIDLLRGGAPLAVDVRLNAPAP